MYIRIPEYVFGLYFTNATCKNIEIQCFCTFCLNIHAQDFLAGLFSTPFFLFISVGHLIKC